MASRTENKKRSVSRNFIFDGMILALLGIAMLIWPNDALKVLCIVCGGCLIVMGVVRLIMFFTTDREIRRISDIIIAIIQLAAGAVLIIFADFFVSFFFVICALLLAYGSFLMFFRTVQLRSNKGATYYISLVIGLIDLAFAVVVILNLSQLAEVSMRIQGAGLIVDGLGMILLLRNLRMSVQKKREKI